MSPSLYAAERPAFSGAVLGVGWKALLAVVYRLRHNASTALEEQCPLHPIFSIDHLEAERVLVSLILHQDADLLAIFLNVFGGCAPLLAFHHEEVQLLGTCLSVVDDYVRPDSFVFVIDPYIFEVHALPVEFNIDKNGLIESENRNDFFLKMVCKPVIDTDFVQLARIVGRV